MKKNWRSVRGEFGLPFCGNEVLCHQFLRDYAQAKRNLRRQDKKMKDMLGAIDDERKQSEQYKQLVHTNTHIHTYTTYIYNYIY